MDSTTLKRAMPTFTEYWERHQEARRNQLPKHLRPPSVFPIWFQIALNTGLIISLLTMISNQDEYLSEYGPAIGMIVCLCLLIYAVISALQLRARFRGLKGEKPSKVNLWLTGGSFLAWSATVATFLR